jgi:hypothetical protein
MNLTNATSTRRVAYGRPFHRFLWHANATFGKRAERWPLGRMMRPV